MSLRNILFLCQDNAAASILAEGYVNVAGRGLWRAYSAGLQPAREVDRNALTLLRTAGIRVSGLHPKSWRLFTTQGAPRFAKLVLLGGARGFQDVHEFPGLPEAMCWQGGEIAGTGTDLAARGESMIALFGAVRRQADALLLAQPLPQLRIA